MKNISKTEIKEYIDRNTDIGPIDSINYVEEGITSEVYKIQTKSGLVFFLRFVNENENASLEFSVYERLQELGVRVPTPIFYEDFSDSFEKRSLMILEELPGKSLNGKDIVEKQILYDAAQDLRKVHSIDVEGFGWINRGIDASPKLTGFKDSYVEYCTNKIEERIQNIVKNEIISEKKSERILSFITKYQELLDVENSHLNHGDFYPAHLFKLNGKYSGILDFGDMKGGSRYHDLVNYWFNSNVQYDDLIDGYFLYDKKPDEFETILKLEKLVFSIRKINWRLKHRPQSVQKRLPKFKEAIDLV